eukprot:CAMPEP_0202693740 /NCGR_PEP_ID=MMETSP1385-20130828/7777_1 /ASSEMBLY_ACC=CAM_ASM_000861 /TAXON_ID=933848 /ORGANISM="Elphidium margaritaceum" /LENGTH=738 /DNA_ID=CAMNT_0049349463 /DNA_START=35 /DNA_END=2248 /DNA_ORIENTATION=+
MHAIPLNLLYAAPHSRRRASESHIYSNLDDTEHIAPTFRQCSPAMRHRGASKNLNPNSRRLNPPNPAAMYTSQYQHQRRKTNKPTDTPKPNRNLRRLSPACHSLRSASAHAKQSQPQSPNMVYTHEYDHDGDDDEDVNTLLAVRTHHSTLKHRHITLPAANTGMIRRSTSPILSSMTRESRSKHKKRSHSFSVSCTFSNLQHSKAQSRRLPPTHYSPSVTHYSPSPHADNDDDCSPSPEITPPPPLSLSAMSRHHHHHGKKHLYLRPRSNSISLSVSRSQPNISTTDVEKTNITKKSARDETSNNDVDERKQTNHHMVDAAAVNLDDIVTEKQFTLHYNVELKPPRTYHHHQHTEDSDDDDDDHVCDGYTHAGDTAAADEELFSYRDCFATENRRALQKEIVAEQNKKTTTTSVVLPNGVSLKKTRPRFLICKGHHFKMDYGSSDGAFTLYKFMITFHGGGSEEEHRDHGDECTSQQWSIKKRFSDFVTFHQNLVAEIKGIPSAKVMKLPKLPKKTLKKNFSASFVSMRHDALLAYLSKLCNIRELQSSVTLLTFLGAVTDHSSPSNDKFLHSRMTVSVYTSNYADSGDVILFETKSYLAAGLRSVTATHYDHVAFVFRDVHGTHQCHDETLARLQNDNDLYLVESTVDGVHTYPLKWRLRQWSILCPQIVVRRLKLLKRGTHTSKLQSSSLDDLVTAANNECFSAYEKYDFLPKSKAFYDKVTEFVDAVNGSEYGIW